MKRIANALFVLVPRRNHVMMENKFNRIAVMASAAAPETSPRQPLSSTAMPIRAETSLSLGVPENASNDNMDNRYLVSRNGALLPWSQIHIQHERNGNGDSSSNNSEENDSLPRDDVDTPMDASTLLQLLPRGAYTTCRTVQGGTHIYQFDYHVRRLALSAQSILENITEGSNDNYCETSTTESTSDSPSLSKSNHPQLHHRTPSKDEIGSLKIVDEAWEREMALNCIRSTLDAFCSQYRMNNGKKDNGHEFRISLLATWEEKEKAEQSYARYDKESFQSILYCHVGILPRTSNISQSTKTHTQVLIHGHGRENALAKDSKWVIDRKKLLKPAGKVQSSSSYEEIILLNDKGELLEGTQTNFYVVKDESIITANEGILHGSVRDSVLRVCQSHNIQVELRPPTLDDLRKASGVFITSTSRLVMPVHEVVLGDLLSFVSYQKNEDGERCKDDALPTSFSYPNCATTENIRKWVLEDVETHSTSVYTNVND